MIKVKAKEEWKQRRNKIRQVIGMMAIEDKIEVEQIYGKQGKKTTMDNMF